MHPGNRRNEKILAYAKQIRHRPNSLQDKLKKKKKRKTHSVYRLDSETAYGTKKEA